MIGYRGCYRYVKEPDLFALELEVLARVREQTPNLHLMIPFVRTKWELEACLELVDASPLGRAARPASLGHGRGAVGRVPDPRVRGAWASTASRIGSNDLTQLMLGVDRDSEVCAELFDESDAAVLDAIRRIIEASRAAGHHVVAVRAGALEPARSSPSSWCASGSRRSRSTRTPSTGPGGPSRSPSAGCCSTPPAGTDRPAGFGPRQEADMPRTTGLMDARVIVTGAGSGIGRAAALQFADEGVAGRRGRPASPSARTPSSPRSSRRAERPSRSPATSATRRSSTASSSAPWPSSAASTCSSTTPGSWTR